MNKTCSKCGAKTIYDGEVHCKKIFADEMHRLLLLKELEKAKALYLSVSFKDVWERYFLSDEAGELGRLILKRVGAEKRHRDSLDSLGISYNGVSLVSATRKHRLTSCYNCKGHLDNSSDIECNICGWIICSCGACGCGYTGESRIN